VVDADSQHLLWTALRWAAAALHQIERVRDSWEQFQAVRKSWLNGGTIQVTPEMERPSAIFWSDMQFLMIAVKHLDFTLEKLGRGTPRLNRTLKDKAVELRQLLEHWWEAEPARKHWKKYRDRLSDLPPSIRRWFRQRLQRLAAGQPRRDLVIQGCIAAVAVGPQHHIGGRAQKQHAPMTVLVVLVMITAFASWCRWAESWVCCCPGLLAGSS